MLDMKQRLGLLEAEQNLLQSNTGSNWQRLTGQGSAWQQIHALIRQMKWRYWSNDSVFNWVLDKTSERDNSDTMKQTEGRHSGSLLDLQSLQLAIVLSTYPHPVISDTFQQKIAGDCCMQGRRQGFWAPWKYITIGYLNIFFLMF